MKKCITIFLFAIMSTLNAFSQIDEFQHKTILIKSDTINYHIYSNGEIEDKNKILVFFHGSGGYPLFTKTTIRGTLRVLPLAPFEMDKIPDDYAFVLISKKGVPFSDTIDDIYSYNPSQTFYDNESLDYRVWQGDKVINELTKKLIKKPEKVVIIGHSEGSDVVAKLGHTNKKVTHIGFWAGGANTQYYDFALFIQKEVQKGKTTQEEAIKSLEDLFRDIKNIESDPNNTEKQWMGNTYRRWSKFTEPAIENLLKIDKPIFVAVAGRDESVPIESSLLIPIEFIRHKKNNLTFKIYPDYNHSFENEDDDWNSGFMKVFEDFMGWIE